MVDWRGLSRSGDYDAIANALLAERPDLDLAQLAQDPLTHLEGLDGIRVQIRESHDAGCPGGGYYRRQPPTIYLHPAIRRRDNFTLLHEFGHHLQQNHDEWSVQLLSLGRGTTRRAEEAVANHIASHVLIPWDDGLLDPRDAHPADVMAGLYEGTEASRSAVLRRVVRLLPDSAKWILAVADATGRVVHAATTYSDFQPGRGSLQPGFAALAAEAHDGRVTRLFTEGIVYSNGSELHGMNVEAVLDDTGYIFVAMTPAERYGTGEVVFPEYECANPACERTYRTTDVKRRCSSCEAPHCPSCGLCLCDASTRRKPCPDCFMVWTPAEIASGIHECEF